MNIIVPGFCGLSKKKNITSIQILSHYSYRHKKFIKKITSMEKWKQKRYHCNIHYWLTFPATGRLAHFPTCEAVFVSSTSSILELAALSSQVVVVPGRDNRFTASLLHFKVTVSFENKINRCIMIIHLFQIHIKNQENLTHCTV